MCQAGSSPLWGHASDATAELFMEVRCFSNSKRVWKLMSRFMFRCFILGLMYMQEEIVLLF